MSGFKKVLIKIRKRPVDEISQFVKRLKTKIPKKIPRHLLKDFTLDNKIRILYSFRDDSYPTKKPRVFSKEYVDRMISDAKKGRKRYYGKTDDYINLAMKKYSNEIKDKEGVDIGSVTGWYSAIMLAHGAKKSYVLEYNKILSKHPKVIPMMSKDFWNSPREFDFGTSISSFEHDGLGRYGDPINPLGDMESMRKMKKVIKKEGLFFLSVPIGKDTLVWNKHRIYGRKRFFKLIEGWELIDSFGFKDSDLDFDAGENVYKKATPHQPVFVLKNN